MRSGNPRNNRIPALLCFVILPLIMLAAALLLDGALVALGPDARLYLSVADNFLAAGHFIQNVREPLSFVVPFGMPLILTLFRALHLPVGAILAVQYALFGLSCWYLSKTERNLSGSGILAPGLFAILLIRTDCLLNNLFVEHYYLPCLCAILWLLTEPELPEKKRLMRLNIAGFAAFAIRPVLIVVYLPILGCTVYSALKKRIPFIAAVLAVALPCLVMAGNAAVNYRETGHWITTGNYTGGDMYIANNPKAQTIFYRARDLDEQVDETYHIVMDDPELDPTEKNALLGARARQWVLANPGQFLKNCAGRFYALFIGYWRGLLLIAFLGGVGFAYKSERWRRLSLACLGLGLLLSALTSMGLIVGRYSIPLLPTAALHLSAIAHWALRRLVKPKKPS